MQLCATIALTIRRVDWLRQHKSVRREQCDIGNMCGDLARCPHWDQEDGCWCTAMGNVQPPNMQCAADNKLGTGVHGLSHVVVGHIGLVVHNNVQHDMRGLNAWLSVCVCVLTTSLACLGR